jgi:DNA-binding MarR family transcriptional regulator
VQIRASLENSPAAPYDIDMQEDESRRFRAAYWRVVRALDTVRLRQWEQSHLTLPQLRVLHHIRRTPGVTTGELARLLGVTVSTTSGLVIKLIDRGLIERSTDERDRRQTPLFLTEAGQAQLGEIAGLGIDYLDSVATSLDRDLWGITIALERLADEAESVRNAADEAAESTARPEALL